MSAIYIHIPFCKQACHYCDFHFSTNLKHTDAMTSALVRELDLRKAELQQPVETIYFGGGTPSILSNDQLYHILEQIYQLYTIAEDPEITLEANPDDLDPGRLLELRALGINRLSIGVQSFFDQDLQWMNRAHTAHEAHSLLKELPSVFDNYTLDLIYGIPQMTTKRWQENLDRMAAFDPPHFSAYALTVEPGTALAHFIQKGSSPKVSEDLSLAHYRQLQDFAKEQGYQNYEFSNYGKPGFFSRNNMAYWDGKSYLGIGPGAHSFDGSRRSWNVSNNPRYIKAIRENELPSEGEQLRLSDRYNEYVMTRLRTMWGIDPAVVEERFGPELRSYLEAQSSEMIAQGKLATKDGNWVVAPEAKFLTDGIAGALFLSNRFAQYLYFRRVKITLSLHGNRYQVELDRPLDLSIPLRDGAQNPAAWYIGPPKFEPVRFDNWTGSVAEGGAVNFFDIHFNPHAHGTHTECLGHISEEKHAINEHFTGFFSLGRVVSVQPVIKNGDQVIDRDQLEAVLNGFEGTSVLIRTLPNRPDKQLRQYSNTNWPYLAAHAALYLREQGIEHLLIDLPSVDKEQDGGKLAAHRAFWNYPEDPRLAATITEMIYIPDAVADGDYLLNLQVAPFQNDAAPSRPVLYRLQSTEAS